jgi:fatty acid desaturase
VHPSTVAEAGAADAAPDVGVPDRLAALQAAIDRILTERRAATSGEDVRHARRFAWLGRAFELTGYALGAWSINPVAPLLIVVAHTGRWGLAHQILHCSYDRIPNCPAWLRSATFARGWRRWWDWSDWILPAAWQLEHNVHHVHTGGPADPDVVEANVEFLRRAQKPLWQKVILACAIMSTWRLSYYAPSTFIQLRRHEQGLPSTTYAITGIFMFAHMFNPLTREGRAFLRRSVLPNAALRFVAIPLAGYPFGWHAVGRLLVTQLVAELALNVYTWALIASSHTADDLHRFDHQPKTKAEWYLHQILGTANYGRGPSWLGWSQAWVNYQIEHHLCPNLTLLQIEHASTAIEEACAKHGVPYLSEPLPRRFAKMFGVIVGTRSMRRHGRPQTDDYRRPLPS